MSRKPDYLFFEYELCRVLEGTLENAKADVEAIHADRFQYISDEELAEHVFSKHEVLPLLLHTNRMEMETHETQVDVRYDQMRYIRNRNRPCLIPGLRVTVSIPFEGDETLWKCRPSRYTLNPPCATIKSGRGDNPGHLEISWEKPSDSIDDGAQAKKLIDDTLKEINVHMKRINDEVKAHKKNLKVTISSCVTNRRERLGKHDSIAKVLNIPLKRNPNAPDYSPLRIKRKTIKPLPNSSKRNPEPGIHEKDYEHILKVIRHEGRSFEATPKTFAKHDEEELRDIILAHLNGHYEGQATGESFRKSGKTDIRIEDQNRAAFVAECKVWRGESEINKALEQLLGYLTWRDCKASLIVFNKRNARFSELRTKLPEAIRSHQLFQKELGEQELGEWRFQMQSAEDADRRVVVHVFLFNLYVSDDKGD